MKKQLPLLVFSLCISCHFVTVQSTGINNISPNKYAALDIQSASGISQGLLIPRLKSNAKAGFGYGLAEQGMIIYGSDTDSLYYWTGSKWLTLQLASAPLSGPWTRTGTNNVEVSTPSDNVGIGVSPAGTKLEIRGVDSSPTYLALRITNSLAKTLMTVSNAGDIAFPALVGKGVVVANALGGLSVKKGNPITGVGAPGKVAFFNTADSISYTTNFHWDNANTRLGIGTALPSTHLHVMSATSPAFRLQDGTQGKNKVLVSDSAGNASWKSGSRYYQYVGLNSTSITATTTPAKIDDFISFAKSNAGTSVEVTMNTNAWSGIYTGSANVVYFEIRIDGIAAAYGGKATLKGSGEKFISCFGVFTGLAAGTHTVSIYASTNGGVTDGSSGVLLDSGGYDGHIVAKETW